MNKEYKYTLAILAAFFVVIAGIIFLSGCNVEQGEPPLSNDSMPGDSQLIVVFTGERALKSFREVEGEDSYVESSNIGNCVWITTHDKDGDHVHEFRGHNISVYRIKKGEQRRGNP